jgi:hypothetical protein
LVVKFAKDDHESGMVEESTKCHLILT